MKYYFSDFLLLLSFYLLLLIIALVPLQTQQLFSLSDEERVDYTLTTSSDSVLNIPGTNHPFLINGSPWTNDAKLSTIDASAL